MNEPNEIPEDIESKLTSYALGDLSPDEMDRVRQTIMESLPALTMLGDIRKTLEVLQTAFADSPASENPSALASADAVVEDATTDIHETHVFVPPVTIQVPSFFDEIAPAESERVDPIPETIGEEIQPDYPEPDLDGGEFVANNDESTSAEAPVEPLSSEAEPFLEEPPGPMYFDPPRSVNADLDDSDDGSEVVKAWDVSTEPSADGQPFDHPFAGGESGGLFSANVVETYSRKGIELPLWKQLPVQIAAGIAILFGSVIYLRINPNDENLVSQAGASVEESSEAASSPMAMAAIRDEAEKTNGRQASAGESKREDTQALRRTSAVDGLLAELDRTDLDGSLATTSSVSPLGRPSALPGMKVPVAPAPSEPRTPETLASAKFATTGALSKDDSSLESVATEPAANTLAFYESPPPVVATTPPTPTRERFNATLAAEETADVQPETTPQFAGAGGGSQPAPSDPPLSSLRKPAVQMPLDGFASAPAPVFPAPALIDNALVLGDDGPPQNRLLAAKSAPRAEASSAEKPSPVVRVMAHIDVATGRLHPVAREAAGETAALDAALEPIEMRSHWVRSSFNGGTDFIILEVASSSESPLNARVLISWEPSAVAGAQPWPPRSELPPMPSSPRELLAQEMTLQPGIAYMLCYRMQDATASEAILGVARVAFTNAEGTESSVRAPIRVNEAATALDPNRRDLLLFEALQLGVAFPDSVDRQALARALNQDFSSPGILQKARALAASLHTQP